MVICHFILWQPEDNRIFRTLGKGVLPLPVFRLRKAGSSRISVRKANGHRSVR